jgi:hypothetical protein
MLSNAFPALPSSAKESIDPDAFAALMTRQISASRSAHLLPHAGRRRNSASGASMTFGPKAARGRHHLGVGTTSMNLVRGFEHGNFCYA